MTVLDHVHAEGLMFVRTLPSTVVSSIPRRVSIMKILVDLWPKD